jgi:mono/diheme cytochrome c family protein
MRVKMTASIALGMWASAMTFAFAQSLTPPTFLADQAKRGEVVYKEQCSGCHGDQLDNGEFAAPLRGAAFTSKWGDKTLGDVWDFMSQQMPPTNPGGLPAATYADLLAYIVSQNGVAASDKTLPSTSEVLHTVAAPVAK